jgi:hypothetical protein
MTTEREAAELWCPFARVAVESHVGVVAAVNRVPEAMEDSDHADMLTCRGSLCMAWRWHTKKSGGVVETTDGLPSGYCGLAGERGAPYWDLTVP